MKRNLRKQILLLIVVMFIVAGLFAIWQLDKTATAQVIGNDVLYTTDADFDQGTMVSVNHDPPNNNQLQLNSPTEPFPYINVAASNRGTMVRIHTETGEILGEYRTAPEGRGLDPSRTTVDLFGNVWTGNREEVGEIDGVPHGSAVKIGLVVGGKRVDADGTPNPAGAYLAPPFGYNTCADRDNDGLIKTSRGLGDIQPWPDITDGVGGTDSIVEDANDECILIYQRLPNVLMVRHLSVDANNDVWVGDAFSWLAPGFVKLSGNTGRILDALAPPTIGCGGYGGLVDGDGVLWSASRWWVLRYDPSTGTGACVQTLDSYGMGIDPNGYIWYSLWPNEIGKLAPDGSLVLGYPKWIGVTGGEARGVAVTLVDNHVWVVSSGSNTASRLDNDGNVLKVIPVGSGPTGVAVDAEGKVWVTNLGSSNVMRIDPNGGGDGLGAVDLTVSLGSDAWPYNYSDMTGIVAISQTSPQGIWTVVQDSGTPGFEWGRVTWNTEPEGSEPPGTAIVVEARAADTEAGLGGQPFQPIFDGDLFSMFGRFIDLRVTLKASSEGVSPVLSDIRVQPHVIYVDIDVKPGSYPNSINCQDQEGVITVAVLTTEDFDAMTVDHTTVTFEGASETHVKKRTGEPRRHEEDVDLDGDMDLVFHFRLGDTTLICESSTGTLIGETYDGMPIEGTDSVRMINK